MSEGLQSVPSAVAERTHLLKALAALTGAELWLRRAGAMSRPTYPVRTEPAVAASRAAQDAVIRLLPVVWSMNTQRRDEPVPSDAREHASRLDELGLLPSRDEVVDAFWMVMRDSIVLSLAVDESWRELVEHHDD